MRGGETEFPSGGKERGPFSAFEHQENVNVIGESRPPQNRSGDASDNRSGRGCRIEPFRHCVERPDERRRRVLSPAGEFTLCQAWPF